MARERVAHGAGFNLVKDIVVSLIASEASALGADKIKPAVEVVMMAAGKGTRMKSNKPKVLQMLAHLPLAGHVLEAARHAGSVHAIVNITTDKCYDNKEWAWGYREDEPMGGYDPYSNSKGCADRRAQGPGSGLISSLVYSMVLLIIISAEIPPFESSGFAAIFVVFRCGVANLSIK
jgi:nucleoside-diphosphate-sugar epimerase